MISTIFDILYVIHHIFMTEQRWQAKTSAIALWSEEIRKEMPVATASGGGVANLSHDLFFILLYFIKKILYAAK